MLKQKESQTKVWNSFFTVRAKGFEPPTFCSVVQLLKYRAYRAARKAAAAAHRDALELAA